MFKLGVVLGYGGSSIGTFADVSESLSEVEIRATYERAEENWPAFVTWVKEEADAVFIYSSDDHEELCSLDKVTVHLRRPEKVTVPPEHFAKVEEYYHYGGEENLRNLVLYMGALSGYDFEPDQPKEIPWQGVYHPELGLFETVEEYERRYGLEPVVGILFHRSRWIDGHTEVVDSVVGELEKRDMGVLPIFSKGTKNERLGNPGNERALEMLEGVDILLNLQSFFLKTSSEGERVEEESPLKRLNIHTLQGVRDHHKTEEEWREDPQGIGPMAQIYHVAQPEFDGTVEPIVLGAKEDREEPRVEGNFRVYSPIKSRIKHLADRMKAWLDLGNTPEEERKITFVLHNSPCKGMEATIGRGSGLDTLESMVRIMRRLKEEGYRVENIPDSGEALIDLIMERKAISDFRWTTTEEIVNNGGVLEFLPPEKYEQWFQELPEKAREDVLEGWGDPPIEGVSLDGGEGDDSFRDPGEGMVQNGKILITGVQFGNVNVVTQPKRGCYGSRCDGEVCRILHDPDIAPTHHWIATYKWIQKNSDVVVHVGTHGYMEFLPGKGVGLAEEDFPEISMGDLPHLYIYTVKNPMEGIIAKRRGYATLVDHLIPVMKPSGLYDDLSDLEELLKQRDKAENLNEKSREKVLREEIVEKAEEAELDPGVKPGQDFEQYVDKLHEKISQLKETQIPYGLHILSDAPEEEELVDLLVSILRFDGEVPSIRRKILEAQGVDYDEALENPEEKHRGKRYGNILDESTEIAKELMEEALAKEGSPCLKMHGEAKAAEGRGLERRIYELIDVENKEKVSEILKVIEYGLELAPQIDKVRREIPQLLRGFDSGFIEPGASGNVTRGRTDVLPTGRNFYAIDPNKIPTKAAWQVGKKLAENTIERYQEEEGRYPETVGMVLWSTDAYRTDGEELSQILYLMGAEPVRDGGRVTGVEIIPLEELGRPRIDTTTRMSGIFRDTLPNLWKLLDEAIQRVIDLDEPLDMNYLKKHTQEMEKEVGEGEARNRIFSAEPGAYGAAVNYAVEASAWEDKADLRDVYVNSAYAYGKEKYGEPDRKSFALNLKNVDLTYNKLGSDESDALNCCCFFAYHGGMTAAAESISGEDVKTYWGDTRDPDRPEVRDIGEEMERIVRTRLINPKWLEGKKEHGYKGAGDISSRVTHAFGWDSTAGVVEDWMYDEIHDRIVKDMKDWFMEKNPNALEEIMRRLLEADERGLWNADEEKLEELRKFYMEFEGLMEEEGIEGDHQGGSVDVMTREDIEAWSEETDETWKEVLE